MITDLLFFFLHSSDRWNGLSGLMLVLLLAAGLVFTIGKYKLFEKAGEGGWKAFIPVLNDITLFRISWDWRPGLAYVALRILFQALRPADRAALAAGFPGILCLVCFVSSILISIVMKNKLARSFGKGTAAGFCLVFMEDVVILLMGMDKSEYYGPTLRKYNPDPASDEGSLRWEHMRSNTRRHYFVDLDRHPSETALAASVIVFACTLYAVAGGLIQDPNTVTPERGERLFRLFTVFSNCVSALGAGMMIPYAIQGVRNKRFVFPKWVAMVQYSGAVCTCLTMIFAAVLILPTMGFRIAYTGMNFWLHALCPVMALVLLFTVESEVRFSLTDSLIILTPFYAYACVYYTNVILIGEQNGGWRDIYRLDKYIPADLSAELMFLLGFGIALVVRHFYNRLAEKRHAAFLSGWDEPSVQDRIPLLL